MSRVRSVIRERISELAWREYDWDGKLGLPIRDDAKTFLVNDLAWPTTGANLHRLPQIRRFVLEPDGTITLGFQWAKRTLILEIPCRNVVVYHRIFADRLTTISGTIRIPFHKRVKDDYEEIDGLIDWLKDGDIHAEDR